MFYSLEIEENGLTYRSHSEWKWWCFLVSSFLILCSVHLFFYNLASLPVFIGLAAFYGYGRVISIDIKDSTISDKKSFLRFGYSDKTDVLNSIGRESGEKLTDRHKIFVENQNGERIVLFQKARYRVDEKWEEIKEHIPEQFLKKHKEVQDGE